MSGTRPELARAALVLGLFGLTAVAACGEPDDAAAREAGLHRANEIARQYWHGEPFPADRGLCIQIWGYLAELGDESATNRLYAIAQREPEHALSAARALYWAGDERPENDWLRLASDRTRSLSERGISFILTHGFFPAEYERVPPEIEALCLEILAAAQTDGASPNLERAAVEALASGAVSPECFEPLRQVIEREINAAGRTGNTDSLSHPACVANAAVAAAGKTGAPEADALLAELVLKSPWASVRNTAVKALANSGEDQRAVSLLLGVFDPAAEPAADRVADAATLVRLGHAPARRTLVDAMYHPDEKVRAKAYAALCGLGDETFLEVAGYDYDAYGKHNGFEWLGGQGFAASEKVRGLQARYMCNVAASAREPAECWVALGLLAEAGLLKDEVRALALPALEETIPALAANADAEAIAAWEEFCGKHAVLLRVGTEAERVQAMERLIQTYQRAAQRHFTIVRMVGRSQYTGAQAFLREQMDAELDSETELVQVFAAIGYLATETDRIPY